MIKVWYHDLRDKYYTDALVQDLRALDGILLEKGHSVAARFPTDTTVLIRSKRPPSDYFTAGVYPVVSGRLRAILDRFEARVEYLPVRLTRKKGEPPAGEWFIANPLEMRDCFDRSRSEFTLRWDYVQRIQKLVIDVPRCGALPLVLTEKTNPPLWIVQEELAAAITAAGCTGVLFRAPEEWQDPAYPDD